MQASDFSVPSTKLLAPIEIKGSTNSKIEGPLAGLTLAATGIVFGDIGTSPLYALEACFDPVHGIAITRDSVFGVLSMVFLAFILVVSIKYTYIVMRANNDGQGGILALMALALKGASAGSARSAIILGFGIVGACLFYGDSVITPAISVLSAVEGIEVLSKGFGDYILPLSISILIGLFLFERKGTAIIGKLFGPIMLLWFLVIGCMGLYQIQAYPEILAALSPSYAIGFIVEHPWLAITVTAALFLMLTGAEALYADMGHFGAKPIKLAWFFLVMPCLLLNYFGQGALILNHPELAKQAFFLMVPSWFTLPLVILATVATVIASQAVISGTYSMTSQAISLGLLPRMKVVFTSAQEKGQIYLPFINWILCGIVIMIVLSFKTSQNLTSAYGIAVSTTMVMTTILTGIVMKTVWKWSAIKVAFIMAIFLVIDLGFWFGNLSKILDGGWFPVTIAVFLIIVMITWYQVNKIYQQAKIKNGVPTETFIANLLKNPPPRAKGDAFYFSSDLDFVPTALLANFKFNGVLNSRVLLLNVVYCHVPLVSLAQRIDWKAMGGNFFLVNIYYGFIENPDINAIIGLLNKQLNVDCNTDEAIFFITRDHLIAPSKPLLISIRAKLFIWMHTNAYKFSDFYKMNANNVVELGSRVELS